jgi:hypothetical protein
MISRELVDPTSEAMSENSELGPNGSGWRVVSQLDVTGGHDARRWTLRGSFSGDAHHCGNSSRGCVKSAPSENGRSSNKPNASRTWSVSSCSDSRTPRRRRSRRPPMVSPAVHANGVAARRVDVNRADNRAIRDMRRPLVSIARVNAVVDLIPDACRHCHHRPHGRDDVGDPRRHQVTELPPIEPHITEYRCHRLRCRACGNTTQASLPDEVAGQFGPQLTALIAYLTVVCRLPRLVVQRLLEAALHSAGRARESTPQDKTRRAVSDLDHVLVRTVGSGIMLFDLVQWARQLTKPRAPFETIAWCYMAQAADALRMAVDGLRNEYSWAAAGLLRVCRESQIGIKWILAGNSVDAQNERAARVLVKAIAL